MALNKVILFGRLVKDPDFRQTQSGTAVCRFTVACDRAFANKETGKREADFIECQAWRQTAEFVSRYFQKGSAITVDGSLRNNNYTDNNGVKHYAMRVLVDNVSFCESKGSSENQQQEAPAQIQQTQAPRAAAPAQEALSIDDLGEFEEILSDGEVPF
jgi:single-strand DNA-binding protein